MAEFTFLEIHFDEADLTANAPYSHGEKDVVPDDEPAADTDSRSGTVFALLVGLFFLAAIAYLVRNRLLGDDEENGASFDSET